MSKIESVLSTNTMQQALALRGVNDLFVEVFDSLPSTSEYLSAKALQLNKQSTLNSPLMHTQQLCVADWQTNGNGRRGKSWVTARGNVTFSLLLSIAKPPADLMGLSLVTGICVAESLSELADLAVQLKWPNDVLVDDGKLCGLLTELVSSPAGGTQIIVGIGVNYNQPTGIEHSGYDAVNLPNLCNEPPARAEIISDISARILTAYALFAEQGWVAFADRWNKYDYLKGRQIRVINAGVEEHATAVGVDSNGALLVERDAQISALYSGEVSVRIA